MQIATYKMDRRAVLGMAGAGLVTSLAACVPSQADSDLPDATPTPTPPIASANDVAILNFALNLEYLVSTYYVRGTGVLGAPSGLGAGPITSFDGPVPFATPAIREFAEEYAADEVGHVNLLRNTLGDQAISRPALDLRDAFTTAALTAGVIEPGQQFNPYADEVSFLLGAYLFEDVAVTAYRGALAGITNRDYIQAAAGIAAAQAYHAGYLRSSLFRLGAAVIEAANLISAARNTLDGPSDLDQGLTVNGRANISPTNRDGLPFARSTQETLRIVYLSNFSGSANGSTSGVDRGGFFPNGLNGTIRMT